MVWKNQISKETRFEIAERGLHKEVLSNRRLETYSDRKKIDLSIFKKRGNEKTYHGWLIQKVKESRQQGNLEVCEILINCYKKYNEFKESEEVKLDSWKGKSSLEIIEHPDYFEIITFQKPTQDDKPQEVKTEITKLEVNRIINTINELNNGEKINTRDIGEKAYKRDWNKIFSDRPLHIQLNLILRLLDYKGLTRYRGKYTTVIKKVKDIQEIL